MLKVKLKRTYRGHKCSRGKEEVRVGDHGAKMVQRREEPVLCSPYENRREGGKMDSRGVEGVRWTSES